MTQRSPNALFGWSRASNPGHNSTRRPHGKKREILGGPAEGGPGEGAPGEGGPAEGGPAEGGPGRGKNKVQQKIGEHMAS